MNTSEKIRSSLINIISVLTVLLLTIFAIEYLTKNILTGLAIFQVVCAGVMLINLYLVNVKKSINLSTHLTIYTLLAILLVFFFTGGNQNNGLLWLFNFSPIVFFLTNKFSGLKYSFTLVLILILSLILQTLGYSITPFSTLTIRQLILSLSTVNVIVFAFSYLNEINQSELEAKSQELTHLELGLKTQLIKNQEIHQNLLTTQSDVEKSKLAMLNLLEDLAKEKDFSEKSLNEAKKFKQAVDSSSNHIAITDSEGTAIYANKAVETTTGFPIEEIIGQKVGTAKLWGGQMNKSYYQNFWDTIKNKKQSFVGEITNRRKNGEYYTALINVSPVLNDKGGIQFFTCIERDISKEKEVDKMKTEFLSLASHQLRTPLTAIRWITEALTMDSQNFTPEQKDYLAKLIQSNQRMITLVNSLLNVSRIESGRLNIDPQPIQLSPIIDSLITETYPQHSIKHQVIKFQGLNSEPTINLDVDLVRQAILNILTNAIKYSPDSGVINLNLTTQPDYLKLAISDTGFGIPKSEQSKLFSKFFRASNAVKIETDGNGLGLYLCKLIMTASGGRVDFESNLSKGTTFNLYFPLTGSPAKAGEVKLS